MCVTETCPGLAVVLLCSLWGTMMQVWLLWCPQGKLQQGLCSLSRGRTLSSLPMQMAATSLA